MCRAYWKKHLICILRGREHESCILAAVSTLFPDRAGEPQQHRIEISMSRNICHASVSVQERKQDGSV